jgi:MFS family permease
MTLPPLLSPLRNDLYRAVWCAMLLSYFGVWIQSVGAAWLMTTIAPTVDFVAWVQAANAIPPILFTVFGGVLADRFDQRLILLFSQIAILSMALAIGAFDYFGIITPWLLLILTFALDSGSAIRYPAYQTTVNNLLPREEIPHALVLSSIGWNIARSVGPAFGGLLIASFGAQSAFIANALFNLPIVAVLFRWRRRAGIQKISQKGSIMAEVRGGLSHVHATPAIRAALLRCFIFTLFASALWSLLPLVAKHVAGGGPSLYGIMLGALGVGALIGAPALTWARRTFGLRRLCGFSALCFAGSPVALALVHSQAILLPILAVGGLGWMMLMSTFNVVVQMAADRAYLGRAVSAYYVAIFSGLALGSWLWGHVAQHASIETGLIASTAGILASLVLYRRAVGEILEPPMPPQAAE